ncbi:HTH-like domain-containing protein [Bradyrhizobium arachidis]|nr:HTH-like domain-containing protein [Bradyrhizobium arachidis]
MEGATAGFGCLADGESFIRPGVRIGRIPLGDLLVRDGVEQLVGRKLHIRPNRVHYEAIIPGGMKISARGRLRDLANERRGFGYRRLFVLLRREGEPLGINRIYRLYCEEGLTVRKRRARRKAVGTRAPILVEAKPNARWSLDFVHDQFANGRRFRILNIVDDVTKECLGAIPDTSISGRRVARELAAIGERRRKPVTCH